MTTTDPTPVSPDAATQPAHQGAPNPQHDGGHQGPANPHGRSEPPLPPEPPQPPPPGGSGGSGLPGASGAARRGDGGARFFGWLRANALPRRQGWLGGVCAGIAWRLGIDPIIVRGVAVVLAVFGLPMLFLYAAAWALLPDESGRIHVEEVLQGRFEPASAGIVIVLVASVLPLGNWVADVADTVRYGYGWSFWNPLGVNPAWAIGMLLVVALVLGIVWLASRGRRGSRSASGGGADAAPQRFFAEAPVSPLYGPPATAADVADPAAASMPDGPPPAPPAPASSSDADLAEWRAQHEAWKQERDAYRREQADAERAARAKWAAENKARAAEFHAAADAARARRRAERPRTSAAFVIVAIGVAILVGGLVAAWALSTIDPSLRVVGIALFAAGAVLGAAMIVAGFARRRSGFLAFLAVTTLVVATPLAAMPARSGFSIWSNYGFGYVEESSRFVNPFGNTSMLYAADDRPTTSELVKIVGDTRIDVEAGANVRVTAELGDGNIHVAQGGALFHTVTDDGTGRSTVVVGGGAGPVDELHVRSADGDVYITVIEGTAR